MNIALCISGHMRNYKNLIDNFYKFQSFLNTIGDTDIFISTWNKKNTNSCWSAAHGDIDVNTALQNVDAKTLSTEFNIPIKYIEVNDYNFLSSEYSPLKYTLFTNHEYNWDSRGIYNNIVHSTKMLFLIYRANFLKSQQEFINNKKYDLVIRTRPDMMYDMTTCTTAIPFNKILDNCLYTVYKPECIGLYDDRFAFGSSDVMNIYSSAFYRISTINDQDIFGDPETVLHFSIKKILKNISIINIPKPGLLVSEKNGRFR